MFSFFGAPRVSRGLVRDWPELACQVLQCLEFTAFADGLLHIFDRRVICGAERNLACSLEEITIKNIASNTHLSVR
jgi:hypothetical protein